MVEHWLEWLDQYTRVIIHKISFSDTLADYYCICGGMIPTLLLQRDIKNSIANRRIMIGMSVSYAR